jgi:inorganic pyrophosphatase
MFNPWHDVPPGNRVPGEFPAIIEIPMRSNVKYELDIVIPNSILFTNPVAIGQPTPQKP